MFESSERRMFSNEHDVIVTSAEFSNLMSGLDTVSFVDGVMLTDVRLSFPEEREKREYPIEDSDASKVMDDTVRSADPLQLKRESVNPSAFVNGLVTTADPSGLILAIP